MEKIKVVIPEENYQIVEFRQEDRPGVMVLNKALAAFEQKNVFAWHLSIMIQLEDLIENGMPSQEERNIIDPYGDSLDKIFKGKDPKKPNALFLARITWDETRELIYRVYDPKPINEFLQQEIDNKSCPRQFDYRIDPDTEWALAKWHLGTLTTAQQSSPRDAKLRRP